MKLAAWVSYLHLDYANLSTFASQLCYIISISNVRIIFSLRMVFHFYITCETCEAFTIKLMKQIRIRFVICSNHWQRLYPTEMLETNISELYPLLVSFVRAHKVFLQPDEIVGRVLDVLAVDCAIYHLRFFLCHQNCSTEEQFHFTRDRLVQDIT